MVAVGREALDMSGRAADSIEVARPLRNGVIADYEITETLLSYMLQRVSGSLRVFRPRVMISVPYGVTSVERRAVYEAVMEAGAREATLISNRWPQPWELTFPSGRHPATWSSAWAEAAQASIADHVQHRRRRYLAQGRPGSG
jgi:hypothetical protein